MLRTIRLKLLLSFLICLSIPAVLGPVLYRYQQERNALEEAAAALSTGQVDLQRTYQLTRDFINFGQRDIRFFESGASQYLDNREQTMLSARRSLNKLVSVGSGRFALTVERIDSLMNDYESAVVDLVQLTRERGFQNIGIIGSMRSKIHELEQRLATPELLVHMLSLRRHEKDYIIRNQPRYVDALVDRAAVLQQAIQADKGLSEAEKDRLDRLVTEYVAAFGELVDIDNVIGVRSATGVFGGLSKTEARLNSELDQLHLTFQGYTLSENGALTSFLHASMSLVAGLSLLFALILSSRLTRPLRSLSTRIQGFVDSSFSEDADLNGLATSDDEVGQIARDFDALQETMREHVSSIRKMAYYDILTGVASRGYLNQHLNDMLNRARRRGEGFALFFIDLDAFKDVNDSLGHDAGDQLLIEIANRLTDAARASDFVARLGGDEFCVLLEELSDEADIASVADRCIAHIEKPVTISGKTFRPQGSIGISRFPEDGADAKELMQAGDNAMYASKVAGHHRFEFFKKEMSQQAADRLTIAQELRAAFGNDEFVLHYQPQVDVGTGKINAWEALVRWQHPERGTVLPGDFLPEIERLGLITDLGNWVVNEACRQLAEWRDEGVEGMRVCVNIAPRQLSDKQLFKTVSQAISSAQIDPGQLELEVTESGIQSAPDGRAVLERLKELGIRVAIDDFGTGYSSLGSLKHLPIDCLKIDRTFVRDMATNSQDAVLLGTIMALGHALKFEIIAEGVEDLEQVQILQGLDCDMIQGYFFSKPVPPSEVPGIADHGFLDEPAVSTGSATTRKISG